MKIEQHTQQTDHNIPITTTTKRRQKAILFLASQHLRAVFDSVNKNWKEFSLNHNDVRGSSCGRKIIHLMKRNIMGFNLIYCCHYSY